MRCAIVIVLLCVKPAFGSTLYSFQLPANPGDPNGQTAFGFIITDGKVGALSSSDILGFQFYSTLQGHLAVDAVANEGDPLASAQVFGDVEATSSSLVLPTPTSGDNGIYLFYPHFALQFEHHGTYADFLVGVAPNSTASPTNFYAAVVQAPAGELLPALSFAAVVPEPGTFLLAAIGLAALFAVRWRRMRAC